MSRVKRWLLGLLGMAVLACLLGAFPTSRAFAQSLLSRLSGSPEVADYDVVIYGGSFSGYSAARMIQKQNPALRVLIICPQRQLGEIGTVAAMNFWDLRGYSQGWIGGTFKELFEKFDRAYDPDEMSAFMSEQLAFDPNIEVRYGADLLDSTVIAGEVKQVQIQEISDLPDGRRVFNGDDPPATIKGRIFIDASYNGRLLRLSGYQGVVGRQDYGDARQQAVTLMFEIEGLDYWKAVKSGDFESTVDRDGSRLLWGGDPSKHEKSWAFNSKVRSFGRLKPLNLAEGAKDRFWVNVMLMYGVDATKETRDLGNNIQGQGDLLSLDEGYVKLREMVETDEFLEAMRAFPGFESIHILRVAPMLYVRESIHSSSGGSPGAHTFAMISDEVGGAGRNENIGSDRGHYARRIGLQFYFLDTQGYIDVDPFESEMEKRAKGNPAFPCFAPYDVLLNPNLRNVLTCGYGINVDSAAWFALRVLPNQMVLGDAAGSAAVLAIERDMYPDAYAEPEIAVLQSRIAEAGGVIEKRRVQTVQEALAGRVLMVP